MNLGSDLDLFNAVIVVATNFSSVTHVSLLRISFVFGSVQAKWAMRRVDMEIPTKVSSTNSTLVGVRNTLFSTTAKLCKNLCGNIFPCKLAGTFVASRNSPIKAALCLAICHLSSSLSLSLSLSLILYYLQVAFAFIACHHFIPS